MPFPLRTSLEIRLKISSRLARKSFPISSFSISSPLSFYIMLHNTTDSVQMTGYNSSLKEDIFQFSQLVQQIKPDFVVLFPGQCFYQWV